MKKMFPWLLAAVFAIWALGDAFPKKEKSAFNTTEFGRLPVLLNGRVQPFDSLARNTLLMLSGKSVVRIKDKKELTGARRVFAVLSGSEKASENEWYVTTNKLAPTEWLLEVMTRPEEADSRKIFRVQHPELETLLGSEKVGLKTYSFNDLTNHFEELETQMMNIRNSEEGIKDAEKLRTPFQKDVVHLYDSMVLYHRLKNTMQPEGTHDFTHELNIFNKTITSGTAALRKMEAGEQYEQSDLELLAAFHKRYTNISRYAYAMLVPPKTGEPREAWNNIGTALMESVRTGEIHPAITNLASIAASYQKTNATEFNRGIVFYKSWLASNNLLPEMTKGSQEHWFNQMEPFYKATVIYVAALLLGCAFWVNLSESLRRSGLALLSVAFVIHTVGVLARMYLEGRPPVTNLYSSAIFVGWAGVLLGIVLERIFKVGIGLVVAAVNGFVTLIIAHHLALSGDTMEMLRAVLDTNLWLSTHVVCITVGYSSMFIAGLIAAVYILIGFFTRSLKPDISKALTRMTYGITCFAMLFSFVGTILGGIWADQSWGRFWGWDPKENGALLIVLCTAITLHARWGGLVRERGLMALAIFGNIVTSFSWFGVNMLGIGLHSYGFMDAAFYWLMLFIASQVVLIAICMVPQRLWASFRPEKPTEPKNEAEDSAVVTA